MTAETRLGKQDETYRHHVEKHPTHVVTVALVAVIVSVGVGGVSLSNIVVMMMYGMMVVLERAGITRRNR